MQRTQKPVKFSQPIFMFEAVGTMFAKKLISEEIVKRNEYFRKKALTAQKSVQNECRRKMLAFFYDRMQPRTP
jgi:hypothetical protein